MPNSLQFDSGPTFSLTVNTKSELGIAICDALFPGGVRTSTTEYPEIFLEFGGQRYRFRMGGGIKLTGLDQSMEFGIHCYGGKPVD